MEIEKANNKDMGIEEEGYALWKAPSSSIMKHHLMGQMIMRLCSDMWNM